MNNLVKVIDNFVEDDYFSQIQSTVTGDWQQWYYQSNIVGDYWGTGGLGKHGFNCWVVQQPNSFIDSYVAGLLTPLFQKMTGFCECENILRSRLDMTLYAPSDNKCHPHIDDVVPHFATIYYFNDSDGNTVIYNEKFEQEKGIPEELTIQREIEPKANRLVVFDGSYIHTGHTPREHNNRIVLNTNLN
tara:strand:+ start:1152 stop:1715 length:564 start_codon:yes stop_codon:yes gene_type:complete